MAFCYAVFLFVIVVSFSCSDAFVKLGSRQSTYIWKHKPLFHPLYVWKGGDQLKMSSGKEIVESYFNYWNLRDMESAINLFDEQCTYEDTLYPNAFKGKEALKSHLFSVAASLPASFFFCLDVISEDTSGNIGVQWHVNNGDTPLPFTRGCSMYKVDLKTKKITSGFDVPEPAPFKSGALSLFLLKSVSGFIQEPKKLIPFFAWVFYCWFLFISNVAPGPNALQLDGDTWREVLGLSQNFWLILPIAAPQYAVDTISPVLEGIFNLLLAWAGLFAGFMVDGKAVKTVKEMNEMKGIKGNKQLVSIEGTRSDKGEEKKEEGNKFIVPIVVMQFLTNAAYLPYLFTRKPLTLPTPTNNKSPMPLFFQEDLTSLENICESKALPLLFGIVGIVSVLWGVYRRVEGYPDWSTRVLSFTNMMNTDRLGFSFVIDLVYFSFFQGWLVNDDLLKRGMGVSREDVGRTNMAKIGTYIPFFGLIYYMLSRPSFPKENEGNR